MSGKEHGLIAVAAPVAKGRQVTQVSGDFDALIVCFDASGRQYLALRKCDYEDATSRASVFRDGRVTFDVANVLTNVVRAVEVRNGELRLSLDNGALIAPLDGVESVVVSDGAEVTYWGFGAKP